MAYLKAWYKEIAVKIYGKNRIEGKRERVFKNYNSPMRKGVMQEQQHQIKIYRIPSEGGFYAVVALDCASLFYLNADIPIVSNLLKNFSKMSFLYPPISAKFDPDSRLDWLLSDKGEEEKGFEHRHGNRDPHDIGLVDDFFFTRLAKQSWELPNSLKFFLD